MPDHNSFPLTTLEERRDFLRWTAERPTMILAHRGAPAPPHPENAIPTFEQALAAAPCCIEIDIRQSRDGVFLLNHDSTLDRCTTGNGPLEARSYAELRELRLKDNDGQPTELRLARLDETIEWARGRTMLFLDIKGGQPEYEKVLRYVRERQAHTFSVVLTYAIEDTLAVHRIDPDLAVYGRATNEAYAAEFLASGIPYHQLVAWIHDETPPDVYRRLHDRGILTTYGTFLEIDRRAVTEGLGLYHPRLAAGADILNSDDVPRAAAGIASFPG